METKGVRTKQGIMKELIKEKYANKILYSDIMPFEILAQLSDNVIQIRMMDAKLTEESKRLLQESFRPGGFMGNTDNDLQKYDYSPNENNVTVIIRRHKDGRWYDRGGCRYILSDKPVKKHDYNF